MRNGFDGDPGAPFGDGRRRKNGTNGVKPDGLNTRSTAFADSDELVDIVAVQADDELINALAAGMTVPAPGTGGYDADDHVAAILAAWKIEIDADPMPELVDLDTAVAAIVAGRPPSRRARHLAPVAAAAAFIVLAVGGVWVGSSDAEPGDVLWPVSKVLYSERAESVEAAVRVETRIANAKQALLAGQPVVAAMELQQAEVDLAAVRPEEGLAKLAEVQDFLAAKAEETPAGIPINPGAPLYTDPARRVPAGATVDSPADAATTSPPVVEPAPVVPGPGPDPQVDEAPAATPDPTTTPEPTPAPDGDPVEPTASPTPQATVEGEPSTDQSLSATPGNTEGSPEASTTTASGTPPAGTVS